MNDPLSFLTSSSARSRVLLALDAEGKLVREELYGRIDASRRTVKRALSALDDRGYVADNGGTYRPTALGRAVANAHRAYVERTDRAERLAPFLSRVDPDEFDLDLEQLGNVEVVAGDEAAPLAAFDRFAELRAAADTVRMVSPVVQAESVAQVAAHAGTDTDTFSFEVVLAADAVDAAREEYGEKFRETLGADEFATYRYEGEVPFVVAVLDDVTAFAVSENGRPSVLVLSESDAAREWANETFERFRERATRLA